MTKNTLGIVFTGFMETIHVQLPNKTINFFMPEIFGENNLLKFIDVFDDKFFAICPPEYNFCVFLILNKKSKTFKI